MDTSDRKMKLSRRNEVVEEGLCSNNGQMRSSFERALAKHTGMTGMRAFSRAGEYLNAISFGLTFVFVDFVASFREECCEHILSD